MTKDYRNEYWAERVVNKDLFDQEKIKRLSKGELMKVTFIMEIGKAYFNRILLIDEILRYQDYDNPFIIQIGDGSYSFNPNVNFWTYIKRTQKYK